MPCLPAASPWFHRDSDLALMNFATDVAYTLDPAGISPLNGDSDTDNNTGRVLSAAARFSRPDWLYIATNGRNGTQPPGNVSTMFPWAGQLISRNGWAAV
jgi:hypothetical protein